MSSNIIYIIVKFKFKKMSKDFKGEEKEISISPNEIMFFKNMLNNFGNAVDIIQDNYEELSKSKHLNYHNHNILFKNSF